MSAPEIEFSVIIPSLDGANTLPAVLDGLAAQEDAPPFEVVLVDDGSTDETREVFESGPWRFPRQVLSQKNLGPAAARNAGIRAAEGTMVAFLGDDTIPAPDWLKRHADRHRDRTDGRALAVVGLIKLHPRIRNTRFLRWIYNAGPQFGYALIDRPDDVDFWFFYGSNLSLARDELLAEPFDAAFPYAAWEDIELGYRLTRSGLKIVYDRDAIVLHDHPTDLRQFSHRQERVGYSAVLFQRRHPILGESLRVEPRQPVPDLPAYRRWLRFVAGYLAAGLSLPRTDLWEEILERHYQRGVVRGLGDVSAEPRPDPARQPAPHSDA